MDAPKKVIHPPFKNPGVDTGSLSTSNHIPISTVPAAASPRFHAPIRPAATRQGHRTENWKIIFVSAYNVKVGPNSNSGCELGIYLSIVDAEI